MSRGTILSLLIAGLFLISPGSIFADSTYSVNIISSPNNIGTISGTFTGTGDTVTSWDLTASRDANDVVFDSADPGSTEVFQTYASYTLAGGIPISTIELKNSQNYTATFYVTGDFTSGLASVPSDSAVYLNGVITGNMLDSIDVSEAVASDDASLTLEPIAATPEPSSLLLMGTGLAGLCAALWRRPRVWRLL